MGSNGNPAKINGSSSVALTAVALQDHWSRSISLGAKFGPKNVGLGPAARAKQKKEIKSVIDTGNKRGKGLPAKQREKEPEKEYVLDKKPPPLTLAQKFGLVNAPKPLLSENEWSEVKKKSNKRDDSGEPCVICKEDFGLEDQVLLSCTHVFHKACLQAFERFTGRKTCPMCRHEQYQTRVIHEGARLHRHRCATKIQSTWRGYVVRSWYRNLRATVPPKDPKLRKKFYEEKMTSIIDRMVKSLDMNMAAFMQELDASVQQSRAIFSQWDATHMTITNQDWEDIQLKAVQRGDMDCPICLTELQLTDTGNSDVEEPKSKHLQNNEKSVSKDHHHSQNKSQLSTVNKKCTRKSKDQKLFAKISNLDNFDVSDVSHLSHTDAGRRQQSQPSLPAQMESADTCESTHSTTNHKIRSTVLLSCSHVFHTTCLNTLEEMAMMDIKNTCPICRAHYQKKVIVY